MLLDVIMLLLAQWVLEKDFNFVSMFLLVQSVLMLDLDFFGVILCIL
jgi:hypothetical protein